MSTSKEFDFYKEMKNVKVYYRYMPGTVILSAVLLVGVVLFVYRMYGILFGSCSWAISDKYFIPPVQFVMYLVMIMVDPSEHMDTICLFGQIMIPLSSFAYCGFMIYMSRLNSSPFELGFYFLLTCVQIVLMVPETVIGAKYFRPFLKRNEGEVEVDRFFEILKGFQLPPQTQ